jgi:hypothetical protein
VGFADASVVQLQGRGPQSTDHGAVSERVDLAIGQLEVNGGVHGGVCRGEWFPMREL